MQSSQVKQEEPCQQVKIFTIRLQLRTIHSGYFLLPVLSQPPRPGGPSPSPPLSPRDYSKAPTNKTTKTMRNCRKEWIVPNKATVRRCLRGHLKPFLQRRPVFRFFHSSLPSLLLEGGPRFRSHKETVGSCLSSAFHSNAKWPSEIHRFLYF
jgi:hypothetical protein